MSLVDDLKASDSFLQGHIPAIDALGWYALEVEKNATKAVEFFETSFQKGSGDAAHNLGYIYYTGLYPGKEIDKVLDTGQRSRSVS